MELRARQQLLIALNALLAGGIAVVICLARRTPALTTVLIAAVSAFVLWAMLTWAARQFENK